MCKMSDKSDEVSRDEWLAGLQNTHVTRAHMNKLIMNYLVTGITHTVLPSFDAYYTAIILGR